MYFMSKVPEEQKGTVYGTEALAEQLVELQPGGAAPLSKYIGWHWDLRIITASAAMTMKSAREIERQYFE